VKGIEAHHILPQKFADRFEQLGFENIHDPRLLTWVDGSMHAKWTHEYNESWNDFFRQNKDSTAEEVLLHAQELAARYNYELNVTVP
jgi:hypothetical protein